MARPRKSGLDYFPLDCQLDDKVAKLEEDHGNDGFTVWIKVMQAIYMTDDGVLDVSDPKYRKLLAKRARVSVVRWERIIRSAMEYRLFDCRAFALDLLTSEGIKKRFDEVERRRAEWRKKKGNQSDIVQLEDPSSIEELGFSQGFPSTDNQSITPTKESKAKERKDSTEREDARASLDHIPGEWSSELEPFYAALSRWGRTPDTGIRQTIRLLRNPRGHPQGARIGDGKIYNGFTDQEILDAIEKLAMAGHWAPKVLVKHVAGLINDQDDGGKDGQRRTTSAGAKGSSHEQRMGLDAETVRADAEAFERRLRGGLGGLSGAAADDLDGRVAVGGDR